ncbi:superoxide dismutase family protein [Dietzia sp. B32]|uniref:superoxide dismutase family protein n=1 Tax=Dietzia sp. B32 TaxID=2915130 RepID=UPI0021AD5EC9|nr:superoxide dismutase family protein [Dietzia sp. B32]UVE93773.1 superoxide dismutase family protein [Dietzia sp. B32]
MTARTVSAARLSGRKSSAFAALGAAALLLASCGTGEDSPAAQGDVESQTTVTTAETTNTENGAGASGGDVFATAELVNAGGEPRGTAEFAETDGGTLVTVNATDLTPGFHGLHIHGAGLCEPDSENPSEPGERGAFLSAGGHLAGPDGEAGHPEHAGDLPTLYVTEDGSARIVTFTDRLDRDLLLDEDGSAVMVHENSDNLANIPERYAPGGPDEDTKKAGDGGSRAACGVVTEQN